MAAPGLASRHAHLKLSSCSSIGVNSPKKTLYGKLTSLSEHPSFAAPLTHAYGVAVGLHSSDWGHADRARGQRQVRKGFAGF